MKAKKLRGHNRIHKSINAWKQENLELDLDYLESYQRNYCKVWVSPFSDISLSNAGIPKPKGKSRKLILEGLLAIYNNWEKQLKTLNKPYYLAIWLYEPNIENSQVVCAIDGMLDFYNITFFRPEKQRKIPTQNYGSFKKELDDFNWVYAIEEGCFSNEDLEMAEDEYMTSDDYKSSQKWYNKMLKKDIRKETDELERTNYFYKQGFVWIGTKN